MHYVLCCWRQIAWLEYLKSTLVGTSSPGHVIFLGLADQSSVSPEVGRGNYTRTTDSPRTNRPFRGKVNIRNRWRMPGLFGSIVGAGIVDGAFQVLGDWSSGLCLSPNQMFWRFYTAFTFGLIAGIAGTVAVGFAVALGWPAIAAGAVGWGVSMAAGAALANTKKLYMDTLTAVAR
jgi:hypothetical protein